MSRFSAAGLVLAAAPVGAQIGTPVSWAADGTPTVEKRICRSTPETGSLVRRTTICRTAAEGEAAFAETG